MASLLKWIASIFVAILFCIVLVGGIALVWMFGWIVAIAGIVILIILFVRAAFEGG